MTRRFARPPVLPVLDGNVLALWPRDAALPAVPLLIGTTETEGTFWLDLIDPDGSPVPGVPPPADEPELLSMIGDLIAIYRPEAAALPPKTVSAIYRDAAAQAGGGGGPEKLVDSDLHRFVFRLRALEAATRHAAGGNPTFSTNLPVRLRRPGRGVPHTAEIPFIFGTYGHEFFAAKLGAGAEVSAMMLETWARFAHDGAPRSSLAGDWTPLSAGDVASMCLAHPACCIGRKIVSVPCSSPHGNNRRQHL